MIFIDANIFMYAAGSAHENKASSEALMMRIARGEVIAATSVEVLQEILHRYRAIGRWRDGAELFDHVRTLMDTILEVTVEDLDQTRHLLESHAGVSVRDCVHIATAVRARCTFICSFDRGFDALGDLARVIPAQIDRELCSGRHGG